ncbi:MAG: hypothetical protein ACRC4M_04185 [Mycoplasma sp.]
MNFTINYKNVDEPIGYKELFNEEILKLKNNKRFAKVNFEEASFKAELHRYNKSEYKLKLTIDIPSRPIKTIELNNSCPRKLVHNVFKKMNQNIQKTNMSH